ncbi:MAG: hypothetical protein IOD11_20755 [Rhodocyclaceae bacterium]|jgi:hypothetical protein|nr:hypothetical protein [Rhodocyclaceae bacterium]MCA3097466.1 hypothetical protein [Rhodocyclaceae bacterium]MCA3120507.1 hypothetical protein [Rhodocyclaceae bacterium]
MKPLIRTQSSAAVVLDVPVGISVEHSTLLTCVKAAVYGSRIPLKAIAAESGMTSSELSRKLKPSNGDPRRLSVDDLVRLIDATGDLSPIYWLIEKFAIDDEARQRRAQAELAKQLPGLIALLKQVGVGS